MKRKGQFTKAGVTRRLHSPYFGIAGSSLELLMLFNPSEDRALSILPLVEAKDVGKP
jgi:hypothetical protein